MDAKGPQTLTVAKFGPDVLQKLYVSLPVPESITFVKLEPTFGYPSGAESLVPAFGYWMFVNSSTLPVNEFLKLVRSVSLPGYPQSSGCVLI